jgi:hypothetical protein
MASASKPRRANNTGSTVLATTVEPKKSWK